MQDQGLKPLPSYDNRPYSNILTRETVLNAAENSGIEGIFFISLIETDKKDNFDSGNKPDPYVYYENIQKLVTGSKETSTQEEQLFFLTSCLYDAKSEKQVWSLTTESDFKYTIKSLNEALTLVINQLKASGLL